MNVTNTECSPLATVAGLLPAFTMTAYKSI